LFSGLTEESIPGMSALATVAGLFWHPANKNSIAESSGSFFLCGVEDNGYWDSKISQ